MPSAKAMTEALNRYIDGKDNNRPAILEALYSNDATLSFSLDDQSMNFPSRVDGATEIARVLSGDFNMRYQRVKTWYLNQPAPEPENNMIGQQPWLVMMQEKATGDIRIGCGFYDWRFSGDHQPLQVSAHQIHIHTMLSFPVSRESWLLELQGSLAYPWSSVEAAVSLLSPFRN